jgi:GNAT superfamily N-acetyltransferase
MTEPHNPGVPSNVVIAHVTEDVVIATNASLNDNELNSLFAISWPSHLSREFGPVLARSLVHLSARAGVRLIGFANVATDGGEHAFLLDPTVAPEFRRRGIGQTLVRRAMLESRARGARWLHVDYAPELEPFYRSAGFRPTAASLIRLDGVG